MATRQLRGTDARTAGVEAVVVGRTQRFATPLVILAGGTVQTPRLPRALAAAEEPQGMANASGQVGRNFMKRLSIMVADLAPDLTLGQRGLPADAICWQFNALDPTEGAVGGFRPGNATVQRSRPRFARLSGAPLPSLPLAVISDTRSFIGLSNGQSERYSLALAVINLVLTKTGLLLVNRMVKAPCSFLAAARAKTISEQISSRDRFTAIQVFGTCRMGDDPKSSVTDAFWRCHDQENLRIADASLFPSTGGGESPALTISALALRQAAPDRASYAELSGPLPVGAALARTGQEICCPVASQTVFVLSTEGCHP